MEVLFCVLYYFFTDPPQKDQRRDRQTKENAGKISHPVTQKEKQRTEQQEVADGAAQYGGHHVEAEDPAAGIQSVEEEAKGHQKPKEKIQQTAQPAPPAPAAEDAEAVIHHPGPQAQGQGREEGGELAGNGDTHGSAEQAGKETALCIPAFFVGQGVNAALYFQIAPVQTELFNVEVLPPHDQNTLDGIHYNAVFVKALHLFHAGDGKLLPPFENDVVEHIRTGACFVICHGTSRLSQILLLCIWNDRRGYAREGVDVSPCQQVQWEQWKREGGTDMLREDVLKLLKEGEGPQSGEEMSQRLGVSRAAVWKAVSALRDEGYLISSAPNRGYRLEASPDRISAGELAGSLAGCVLGRELICLDTVDSTNSEIKRRALEGAAEGLTVLADQQTAGRGRRGRGFVSPAGKGLYLSVLLRPESALRELLWLTAWTGVAVCDAVEEVCGFRPGIKWTNDIVWNGRKLCGILTELGMEGEGVQPQYVVIGVGINVSQTAEDFGPEVAPLAVSLGEILEHPPRRAELAAALLRSLDTLRAEFPRSRERYLEQYRRDCVTLGKEVRILRGSESWAGVAEEIDEDFQLVVRRSDGRREIVNAGEVSVRGMLGYV